MGRTVHPVDEQESAIALSVRSLMLKAPVRPLEMIDHDLPLAPVFVNTHPVPSAAVEIV
jgi:hypothetical protein